MNPSRFHIEFAHSTNDLLPTLQRALDLDVPSLIEVPVDYRENLHLAERLGGPLPDRVP